MMRKHTLLRNCCPCEAEESQCTILSIIVFGREDMRGAAKNKRRNAGHSPTFLTLKYTMLVFKLKKNWAVALKTWEFFQTKMGSVYTGILC